MMAAQSVPQRASVFSLGLPLLALLLMAGCLHSSEATEPKGTDYVVFIDFSQSVRKNEQMLFKEALVTQIIPTLSAGDRLLVAPITEKTLTGFRPLIEVTLPPLPDFNGWSDNLLKHQQQVREVEARMPKLKEEITAQISRVFSTHYASSETDIFSSLLLAQKLFHNESRNKVLVLMSDMIEDYKPYRFQKVSWSPEVTYDLLTELDREGMIPDLSDVCIYVAGASATSPMQAERIAGFWQTYFELAKADMHPSRYAHVLLHWPPSTSCVF